jgi:N-acetylglucosamine kinase-like BadF-type ATPase
MSPVTVEEVRSAFRAAVRRSSLHGVVVLTDDAVVPLLAAPLNGVGISGIVGTGTILLARGTDGPLLQWGGYEYVLADQGGGFDIGLKGLRAGARAYDGRGPRTELLDCMQELYEGDIPRIGADLAGRAHPKQRVAEFAKSVCLAADAGDAVAGQIVAEAATEIAEMFGIASRALAGAAERAAATGSVVACCGSYERVLRTELGRLAPGLALDVRRGSADRALDLARVVRETGQVPDALESVPHVVLTTSRLGDGEA